MADTIASLAVRVSADVTDVIKGFEKIKSDMSTLERGMSGFGTAFKAIGATSALAIGGIAAAIGSSIGAASDFEGAFTGVIKTVDATDEQLAELRSGILEMTRKLPDSASNIASVAEAAGQLGIEVDSVLGFTRVMSDLGVTTNLSSTDAATALARLANITGMSQTDFDRLGSSIVALGNNLATTEAEIVEMGLRIAGAGTQIGLTEPQILALAGSLSSVGIEAEAGGTAISRVMIDMAQEVARGGEKLEAFADVAGMSSSEFATAFEQDAANAIIAFISGLDGISKTGGDVFGVLEELGLSEIRVRDALLRASGASDLFRDSIILSSTAWEENIALTKEAELRYNTVESRFQLFRNAVDEVRIGIGDGFLPVWGELLNLGAKFIQSVAPPVVDWFGEIASASAVVLQWLTEVVETGKLFNSVFAELPTPLQNVIAATNNLVESVRSFLEPIAAVISNVVKWQDVLNALGVIVLWVIGTVLSPFIATAGAMIAIFAALVAASALLRIGWEEDWLGIRSALTFAWDIISGIFNSVAIKVGWIVETFKAQWGILQDTNATLGDKLALIWNTLLDLAHTVWQGIVTAVQILWPRFVDALTEWGKASWEWLQNAIPEAMHQIAEWGSALWGWLATNLPVWIDTLMKWAGAAWEWIVVATSAALGKLGEWGAALWGWLTSNLPGWLDKLAQWGMAAWQWIVTATTGAVQRLGDWGAALWQWLTSNLPTWVQRLSDWAKGAWQWIVDATAPAVQKLGEWGEQLIGWLASNLPTWIATIFEWATAVVVWITDAIPGAITNLTNFIRGLREEGSGPGLTSFLQMATQWGTALWEWITKELIPAVAPAWASFMQAMGAYGLALLQALGELAIELGITLWQWIVDVTPTAVQKLKEWGSALWGWVQDNMPTWVEKLGKWATAAWEWLTEAIQPALVALKGWGSALWAWIVDNAPEWAAKLGEWGKKAWEWIVDMIPPTLTKLGEWGGKILQWATDNVGDWVTKFKDIGRDIVQGLRDGIEEKWNGLTSWFSTKWSDMVGRFKNFFGIHSPSTLFASFGIDMMDGLRNGIDSAASGPVSAISGLASQVQSRVDSMVAAVQSSLAGINTSIGNVGSGTPSSGGGSSAGGTGFVPTAISELEKAIAVGGFKLGVGVQQVSGLTDTQGFATEFMEFVNRISDDIRLYDLAPAGSAAGNAATILQSGSVFDQKVDDVLSALQLLIRTLTDKGLGNQFLIEAPPNEDLNAKYQLIELVQYLQALYG